MPSLVLSLALLLLAPPLFAAKPPLCPGGTFVLDEAVVTGAGTIDAVVVDGTTLALGSSCSGPVRLKAKRKGTAVRGKVPCAAGGRARLSALIGLGCERLTGRLRLARQRFKVAATRAPETTTSTTTNTISTTMTTTTGASSTTTTTLPFSTSLIARDWTVPASSDTYRCRRVQVPADVYVTGFRPAAAAGTVRMLVTVEDALGAGDTVGDYDCAGDAASGGRGVFAAGLGTGDLVFPAGYGVHLQAGQYLNLELHLVNPDASDRNGTSGVLVQLGAAADLTHEVELVFAGSFAINLPSNGTETTVTGGCTAASGSQIVAVWPHMHALGTHAMLTVTNVATPQVVLDAPFSVDAQQVHVAAATVEAGGQIEAACTYVNSTGGTVVFGPSAAHEQCFIGMYRSPVGGGDLYGCVSF